MTQPVPEGEGTPIDVAAEGSWTDGVFQQQYRVTNDLEIVIRYNFNGEPLIDALLTILQNQWPEVHERIVEAIEVGRDKGAITPTETSDPNIDQEDVTP